MNGLLVLVLTLLGAGGLIVVLIRDPVRQAIALGVFGLLEGLTFFAVQAPDVALSQIVVGGLALPAMLFLAIAEIRSEQKSRREEAGEDK